MPITNMAHTTTLLELVGKLPSLDDHSWIIAERPWSELSQSLLVTAPAGATSAQLAVGTLEYFLDVSVAKEVCEVFGARVPSTPEVAKLLLFYAENDAFPDWVYEPSI